MSTNSGGTVKQGVPPPSNGNLPEFLEGFRTTSRCSSGPVTMAARIGRILIDSKDGAARPAGWCSVEERVRLSEP